MLIKNYGRVGGLTLVEQQVIAASEIQYIQYAH